MTAAEYAGLDATALAAAIRRGDCLTTEVLDAAFSAIADRDAELNCFTALTQERAYESTGRVAGGPLAGVPFGAKNLFDIAGLTTVAGSKIRREAPPAACDAASVHSLHRAGAVLCGTLNMDEFAYGFVTENAHDGPTRNPRDPTRIAGGSSGGSAAAVAAGLVPIALGTDTNGSVRVPASLCGVFGLKPTFGRVSRAGTFPFADSFDHVGLFTRSVRDLTLGFELLVDQPVREPDAPLRIAVLEGYFAENAQAEALDAVMQAARVLRTDRRVTLPRADLARGAAYLITAAEGGALHLADLRRRAHDFDPATRDRLLAGALIPAVWVQQAQRFRAWFRERVREVFTEFDILLAPATPCVATHLGQRMMNVGGNELPVRANLGLFTQPFSFVGLPVVCAPTWPSGRGGLPIGVQIVAAPHREAASLQVAATLERAGFAAAPPALLHGID